MIELTDERAERDATAGQATWQARLWAALLPLENGTVGTVGSVANGIARLPHGNDAR